MKKQEGKQEAEAQEVVHDTLKIKEETPAMVFAANGPQQEDENGFVAVKPRQRRGKGVGRQQGTQDVNIRSFFVSKEAPQSNPRTSSNPVGSDGAFLGGESPKERDEGPSRIGEVDDNDIEIPLRSRDEDSALRETGDAGGHKERDNSEDMHIPNREEAGASSMQVCEDKKQAAMHDTEGKICLENNPFRVLQNLDLDECSNYQ